MWCSSCRQDVPGTLFADRGQICCPRCGDPLDGSWGWCSPCADARRSGAEAEPEPLASPAPGSDEWEMEERLRHLERVLAKTPPRAPASASGGPVRLRIDAAHPTGRCRSTPAWNLRRENGAARWAWRLGQAILAIGLAASACGGSLVAWSAYTARPELWSVGIPIAIGGQIAMLIALAVRSAGSAPADPAADGSEVRPYARMPGLRIDPVGHLPEMAPSQALLDVVARLEELSKKLDHQAD